MTITVVDLLNVIYDFCGREPRTGVKKKILDFFNIAWQKTLAKLFFIDIQVTSIRANYYKFSFKTRKIIVVNLLNVIYIFLIF